MFCFLPICIVSQASQINSLGLSIEETRDGNSDFLSKARLCCKNRQKTRAQPHLMFFKDKILQRIDNRSFSSSLSKINLLSSNYHCSFEKDTHLWMFFDRNINFFCVYDGGSDRLGQTERLLHVAVDLKQVVADLSDL